MQSINNFALAIGYIVIVAFLIYIIWYAVAAVRRHHRGREERAKQRAKANAQSETPTDELEEIGYESWGVHREV